jgi:hypothetical protein
MVIIHILEGRGKESMCGRWAHRVKTTKKPEEANCKLCLSIYNGNSDRISVQGFDSIEAIRIKSKEKVE